MKAKVKNTGETVDVKPTLPINCRVAAYETELGRKFPMFALEFEKEIDWEQRRYEIARELMAQYANLESTWGSLAQLSVKGADALISELKKRNAKTRR